jgi:hypothetical protein
VTNLVVRTAVILNAAADAAGRVVLAPIGLLPGWLSATLVAVVTGVLLLVVFKYTSNQNAIKRTRNDINAHLLALKLFKDSLPVTLRAQGRIFLGAGRLFVYAIVPMLVMAIPVTLLLGQLSLWYQFRPLSTGEEAVVTLALNGDPGAAWPEVRLEPTDAVEVVAGPVRVRTKREVCWNVKAKKPGEPHLVFQVDGKPVKKELAIGDGFTRVSKLRPDWSLSDILMNPGEPPFPPGSPVRSIEINYPGRSSWTSGTDYWVGYWFLASMVGAFAFRGLLKVNV